MKTTSRQVTRNKPEAGGREGRGEGRSPVRGRRGQGPESPSPPAHVPAPGVQEGGEEAAGVRLVTAGHDQDTLNSYSKTARFMTSLHGIQAEDLQTVYSGNHYQVKKMF